MKGMIGYPWPDPTDKRIKELESEVKRLREGWMKQTCRLKSLTCGRSKLLRRAATDEDIPTCGKYCEAVIKHVARKEDDNG